MIENIIKKLSEISARFKEVEILLSEFNITQDKEKYISLSKEYADLSTVVNAYNEYLKVNETIKETLNLSKDADPDIRQLADSEIKELNEKLKILEKTLQNLLLPKDPDDSKKVL